MISKDYIMRMIEQFTKILSRIIFNKENSNYEEARSEIENAFKNVLGFDYNITLVISHEDLLKLLKFDSEVNDAKCIVAAELLKKDGEILELMGNEKQSIKSYENTLFLYLEIFNNQKVKNLNDIEQKIESITDKLIEFNLSSDIKKSLVTYFEIKRNYGRAEDIIFDLFEAKESDNNEFCKDFFTRLLLKDDRDLRDGLLPREEVIEGLKEFEMRKQSSRSNQDI